LSLRQTNQEGNTDCNRDGTRDNSFPSGEKVRGWAAFNTDRHFAPDYPKHPDAE